MFNNTRKKIKKLITQYSIKRYVKSLMPQPPLIKTEKITTTVNDYDVEFYFKEIYD